MPSVQVAGGPGSPSWGTKSGGVLGQETSTWWWVVRAMSRAGGGPKAPRVRSMWMVSQMGPSRARPRPRSRPRTACLETGSDGVLEDEDEDEDDPGRRLNLLQEYLQALALRSLHESEAFHYLSFVNGTALRFLYSLPRFSEDLEFSLEDPGGYEGARWAQKLKRDLHLAGYDVPATWNDRKTVHMAWVRVGGLLHEAGPASDLWNGGLAALTCCKINCYAE